MIRFSASGQYVQMGDRVVPQRVELEHSGSAEPTLYVRVEIIDGVPQCREVRLYSDDDADEIRSTDVKLRMGGRWTGIDELTEQLVARMMRFTVNDDGAWTEVDPVDERVGRVSRGVVRAASQAARRKMTPKLLAEVAKVYRSADSAPTQAVARHFGIAHRTAALWVKRAREAGKLGKATIGKAGG